MNEKFAFLSSLDLKEVKNFQKYHYFYEDTVFIELIMISIFNILFEGYFICKDLELMTVFEMDFKILNHMTSECC